MVVLETFATLPVKMHIGAYQAVSPHLLLAVHVRGRSQDRQRVSPVSRPSSPASAPRAADGRSLKGSWIHDSPSSPSQSLV